MIAVIDLYVWRPNPNEFYLKVGASAHFDFVSNVEGRGKQILK